MATYVLIHGAGPRYRSAHRATGAQRVAERAAQRLHAPPACGQDPPPGTVKGTSG
jgi:hypothetical protein